MAWSRKRETRRDPHAARETGSQKAPEEATSPVVSRTLMGRVAFRRHRLGPSPPARETDPTECSFTPPDTAFIDHQGLDFHLLTEITKTTQTHHPTQAPIQSIVAVVTASRIACPDQVHFGDAWSEPGSPPINRTRLSLGELSPLSRPTEKTRRSSGGLNLTSRERDLTMASLGWS